MTQNPLELPHCWLNTKHDSHTASAERLLWFHDALNPKRHGNYIFLTNIFDPNIFFPSQLILQDVNVFADVGDDLHPAIPCIANLMKLCEFWKKKCNNIDSDLNVSGDGGCLAWGWGGRRAGKMLLQREEQNNLRSKLFILFWKGKWKILPG